MTEPWFLEKVKKRAGDTQRLWAEGDRVRRRAKIQVHVLTLRHAIRKSFELPEPWLFQLRDDSLLHEATKRLWEWFGCRTDGDLYPSPTIS